MTSSSSASPRASLRVRISLVILAVLAGLAAAVCAFNLLVAGMFNSATENLTATIAQYSTDSPDLELLAAQQTQTDSQFEDASQLSWLQLPALQQSVEKNKAVSAALTAQIKKDMEQQNSSDASSQSSSSDSSSSSSDSSSSSSSSSTSTLDQDTQERMRTLTDNNAQNQQTYTPQAPKTTTKKPW
ncbi:DUF6466 family protein [Alloscardovia macacae]|uniref:DUF6466 family protein n=1 Tax=Alloscardovia macacae TaxID=1160091 RepID=UPI0015D809BD|nr:DUF6466 family protein [Alloscardovia macacae]